MLVIQTTLEWWTNSELLQHLSSKQIATTERVRANRMGNVPSQGLSKMTKRVEEHRMLQLMFVQA